MYRLSSSSSTIGGDMRLMNMVSSIILCFTLGLTALAQGAQNKKATQGHRAQGAKGNFLPTSDQQSALIVLDQLFEATKGFEDDVLRIRPQAHVADVLWPYDEPRARRQFEESFHAVMSAKTASPSGA